MAARIVIPPSGKASFGRRLKLNGRNVRKHDFQDSLRQRLLLGNSRDHLNGRHEAHCGPTAMGREQTGSFGLRVLKSGHSAGRYHRYRTFASNWADGLP